MENKHISECSGQCPAAGPSGLAAFHRERDLPFPQSCVELCVLAVPTCPGDGGGWMKQFPSQGVHKGGHRAPRPTGSQQGPHSLGLSPTAPPKGGVTTSAFSLDLGSGGLENSTLGGPGRHTPAASTEIPCVYLETEHKRQRCLNCQILLTYRNAGNAGITLCN